MTDTAVFIVSILKMVLNRMFLHEYCLGRICRVPLVAGSWATSANRECVFKFILNLFGRLTPSADGRQIKIQHAPPIRTGSKQPLPVAHERLKLKSNALDKARLKCHAPGARGTAMRSNSDDVRAGSGGAAFCENVAHVAAQTLEGEAGLGGAAGLGA